jgi:hypothetical protein
MQIHQCQSVLYEAAYSAAARPHGVCAAPAAAWTPAPAATGSVVACVEMKTKRLAVGTPPIVQLAHNLLCERDRRGGVRALLSDLNRNAVAGATPHCVLCCSRLQAHDCT